MLCMQIASLFSDVCSTAVLRSTNGVLAVICSILVYEIITCLRPTLDDRKATLYAVVLALYPLHWFFTFLYYTDVASTTIVLSMYLACLKKSYLFSALLGVLAIFIRQTNIIWMLFIACVGVINCTVAAPPKNNVQLDDSDVSVLKDGQLASNKGVTVGPNMRKRSLGNALGTVNHAISRTRTPLVTRSSGLFNELQDIILKSWHLKWELLVSFGPFFIVLVAFVTFVHWNGSVVLGAKEAHAVSLHFTQIMYFSLVSTLFMAPVHFTLSRASVMVWSFWKNKPLSFFQWSVALAAGFLSVHFFSIAHPYLLADNRHYTFYLWRKVIKAHWSMKYLLVPLYVYSWLSIFSILAKVQKKIWVVLYFLASAAVLIPAPLIEFRYYTIPFFFLVLHSHVNDYKSWLLMAILYLAINVFTMIMFLFRSFHWDHEPGIQRFIW
ncbi:dol-P-Glc:Glc(2)Man(9)GlcNAc(2)-PP-Dol alpha-1,2-glucosyltransferase isoform X2 [Cornus florida]|nr:dol-P-Glc:Glc(2)Man(9)GlcNAc(2)-PP-Dol alpha-1,2-glucosyltransferase isoform X2 [Cornus florida]